MNDIILEFLLEYNKRKELGTLEGWHFTTYARLKNGGQI